MRKTKGEIERSEKLLESLTNNPELKKAAETLSKFLGSFQLWMVRKKAVSRVDEMEHLLCKHGRESERMARSCVETIGESAKRSARSKGIEPFKCQRDMYGFCLALHDAGEIFGYAIVCGLHYQPPAAMMSLFANFLESVVGATRKDIELEELRKTIKPRTIALSTVHTIHRLITSTVYLDELLSRIARLSMQVIKANRCSVKLVDAKKKTLLPKTTVDVRTNKAKLKKVKIGRWAPGKAVKYGKSIRSETYLATPLIDEDVIGVITLYDKVDNEPFNSFDEEIMRTLAEQAAVAIKNAQLYKEQEKLTMGSIKALAQIIESRGPGIYAPKTSYLVKIAQSMGQELGMREHELKSLQYATLLHDAGELMIPERLLKKKGKLTDKEYKLIKEHPLKGASIIKSLKSIKSVTPIIMHHHENFDGTGYPKGLKANEIPLGARIMAVAGAFGAMITKRPYRVPLTIDAAIDEIKKHSGRQFDPKVVDVFLKVIKRKDIKNLVERELGQ